MVWHFRRFGVALHLLSTENLFSLVAQNAKEFDNCMDVVKQVLKDAAVNKEDIDDVVLVCIGRLTVQRMNTRRAGCLLDSLSFFLTCSLLLSHTRANKHARTNVCVHA